MTWNIQKKGVIRGGNAGEELGQKRRLKYCHMGGKAYQGAAALKKGAKTH